MAHLESPLARPRAPRPASRLERESKSPQTEHLPLRVIMAANRWGCGCESLGDAGREIVHELKSRIQPKIGAPRIIIFDNFRQMKNNYSAHNRRISGPTIPRPGAGRRVLPVCGNARLAKRHALTAWQLPSRYLRSCTDYPH